MVEVRLGSPALTPRLVGVDRRGEPARCFVGESVRERLLDPAADTPLIEDPPRRRTVLSRRS